MKKVLVVMGSDSDLKVMEKCVDRLKSFDIPTEVRICSAHRTPAARSTPCYRNFKLYLPVRPAFGHTVTF